MINATLIGKVLVNTAMQATLGNLELPSRLLLRNFTNTQGDADSFIDATHGYILIGGIWTLGTTILMYVMHEHVGALLNLLFQLLAMTWIISRRYSVYIANVQQYNLKSKSLFDFS
jgi:hypothetical protein